MNLRFRLPSTRFRRQSIINATAGVAAGTVIIAIAATVWRSLGPIQGATGPDPAEVRQLTSAMDALEPWGRRAYSRAAWEKLIALSKRVQATDRSTVACALMEYSQRTGLSMAGDGSMPLTKPMLLLRVTFQIPDRANLLLAGAGGGWISGHGRSRHSTASWPIEWNGETPALTDALSGYEGPPYNPTKEYEFMAAHFPYRNLELVRY